MTIDPFTIFLGIAFAIVAAFCFNYAIILEKKGLLQGLPDLNFDEGIKSVIRSFIAFFKNRDWAFGFLLGNIGYIPYLISQNLVGIVVTQPITSVGLIVLVIAANKILNEKIGPFELSSFIMMGFGTILIGLAQVSDIFIDILEIAFPLIIFTVIIFFISGAIFLIASRFKGESMDAILMMIIAGLITSLGSIFSSAFVQAISYGTYFQIPILAPIEILFGCFWFWDPYHWWGFCSFYVFIIFNSVGFAFTQGGLQRGKAVLVFPIVNTVNMIAPIIAGFIIFQQTFQNYLLFYIGVSLILIATVILSRFQAKIEAIEAPEKSEDSNH